MLTLNIVLIKFLTKTCMTLILYVANPVSW